MIRKAEIGIDTLVDNTAEESSPLPSPVLDQSGDWSVVLITFHASYSRDENPIMEYNTKGQSSRVYAYLLFDMHV